MVENTNVDAQSKEYVIREILPRLNKFPPAARKIPEYLRSDFDLAKLVLAESSSCFQYLGDELKANLELAKMAMEYSHNIKYVSDVIKNNEEFMLYAIEVGNDIRQLMRYATTEMKDNERVARAAVKKEGWTFTLLSKRLKSDIGIMGIAANSGNISINEIFANLKLSTRRKFNLNEKNATEVFKILVEKDFLENEVIRNNEQLSIHKSGRKRL